MLIGAALISSVVLTHPNQQPKLHNVPAPTISELLDDVNKARGDAGVSPLIEDPRLDQSAQIKANDMQTNGYGHTDGDGQPGYTLAHKAIPACIYVSESLDAAETAQETISEWLNSPPHRAALLDPKYSLTGFGVVAHSDYYYVVEHYCQIGS